MKLILTTEEKREREENAVTNEVLDFKKVILRIHLPLLSIASRPIDTGKRSGMIPTIYYDRFYTVIILSHPAFLRS